jgi:hypothetical protein
VYAPERACHARHRNPPPRRRADHEGDVAEHVEIEAGRGNDPENFNPGYLMRGMHLLPKRGDKKEWQHTQDYWNEKDEFPAIGLDGPEFVYG